MVKAIDMIIGAFKCSNISFVPLTIFFCLSKLAQILDIDYNNKRGN